MSLGHGPSRWPNAGWVGPFLRHAVSLTNVRFLEIKFKYMAPQGFEPSTSMRSNSSPTVPSPIYAYNLPEIDQERSNFIIVKDVGTRL